MWPPRDWRSLIALLGSIAGAAFLTGLVWWGVIVLLPDHSGWTPATERHRAETIRWVLWIMAATISVVIIGLGMVINRRSLKAQIGKNSFGYEGGEMEAAAHGAQEVAEAARDKADAISSEMPEPELAVYKEFKP